MEELRAALEKIFLSAPEKLVISKPATKSEAFKKIVVERKVNFYQIAKYTEKQVFHENLPFEKIVVRCAELVWEHYLQVNAWDVEREWILLISRKGKCMLKAKAAAKEPVPAAGETTAIPKMSAHNRRKNYLLTEGSHIEPLIDMGIFTQEGKVVRSMYDKYRQINRFIEMIDDAVRELQPEHLNIIDFGCGKSYLTFLVYYYFTEIRKIDVQIIGLDLKADVIEKCNAAAQKYGYRNLRFEMGNINGYSCPFDVDMVMTLHACDTATDFALFNAVQWNAKMIFSVPCCQHELNGQMQPETLALFSRYGIIQERTAALMTDAIRANLLEYSGYRTQLLEFVDLEHTPKNILIRAVRRPTTPRATKEKMLAEVEAVCKEFHVTPTLYQLLVPPKEPH